MIRVNELRLGNYVTLVSDITRPEYRNIPLQVDVEILNIMEVLLKYSDKPFAEPIPLTEEWLLKCGFKYDCDLINSLCLSGIWFNKNNMEATYLSQKLIKIKYLHQLQNLYFALTGEELTIKL